MEDMNRISYFLLGLGVGAAVGVLFTPKSGPETRDYIQTKSRETADTLKRGGEDLRNRAVETMERGKRGVRDQLNNLSAVVDAGTQAFHEAVEQTSRTAANS